MFDKKLNTRKLVMVGLFIAMQIIFTRFSSINLPNLRIGFNYLPLSICSIMFGPLTGGIAAAVADFIGVILFPSTGAYFPGFTLTMFLTGATYGFFTNKMGVKILPIVISVVVVCIGLNLLVDTFWLKLILGKGYLALLPARALKSFVMIPIQVVTIPLVWKLINIRHIKSFT